MVCFVYQATKSNMMEIVNSYIPVRLWNQGTFIRDRRRQAQSAVLSHGQILSCLIGKRRKAHKSVETVVRLMGDRVQHGPGR